MNRSDDPLAPHSARFAEPWHAQTLAIAQGLIAAGHLSPSDWSRALGTHLARAKSRSEPDTEDTYYRAALDALEAVTPLLPQDLAKRKADWEAAYARTPHGQPVTL